jgi:transaldolase
MAIFLDCFEPDEIARLVRLGMVSGITTNPKLVSRQKTSFSMKERIEKICSGVNGPVAVEVTASEVEGIVAQAREFYSWNPSQIVVKVPVSMTGYEAIAELEKNFSIPTMATCVMTFTQAYAAALAGAHYVALFWGRMEEASASPVETVMLLSDRLDSEKLTTRILAASIRGPHHVHEALSAGVHIITISPRILREMLQHPATEKTIAEFAEDWRCARERGLLV